MLQELENLHKQCFPNRPWTANDFAELKKSGCDVIAGQNGFIVYRVVADESEIISLGTLPAMRRTGIGGALVQIAAADAKKRGAKKMFLEVARDNTPAINMYHKFGFVDIGVRPKYYDGIDAIMMAKEL